MNIRTDAESPGSPIILPEAGSSTPQTWWQRFWSAFSTPQFVAVTAMAVALASGFKIGDIYRSDQDRKILADAQVEIEKARSSDSAKSSEIQVLRGKVKASEDRESFLRQNGYFIEEKFANNGYQVTLNEGARFPIRDAAGVEIFAITLDRAEETKVGIVPRYVATFRVAIPGVSDPGPRAVSTNYSCDFELRDKSIYRVMSIRTNKGQATFSLFRPSAKDSAQACTP